MKELIELGKKDCSNRKQREFQSALIQSPSFFTSSSSFFNSKLFNTTALERREHGESWKEKGGVVQKSKEEGGRMNKRGRLCGRTERTVVGRGLKLEETGNKENEGKKKEEERKMIAKMNEKEWVVEKKGSKIAEGVGIDREGRVEGLPRKGLWRKEKDSRFGDPFLYCASARISLDNGFEEYGKRMQKRLYMNILDN